MAHGGEGLAGKGVERFDAAPVDDREPATGVKPSEGAMV